MEAAGLILATAGPLLATAGLLLGSTGFETVPAVLQDLLIEPPIDKQPYLLIAAEIQKVKLTFSLTEEIKDYFTEKQKEKYNI